MVFSTIPVYIMPLSQRDESLPYWNIWNINIRSIGKNKIIDKSRIEYTTSM